MVEVTYHCPYCGAVTSIDRAPSLQDASVTRHPLADHEYAATTADIEAGDGIEFVCLGDVGGEATAAGNGRTQSSTAGDRAGPRPERDGCGRTFYLNYRQSPPPTVGPTR